jgi:hypothetical protein
VDNLEPVDSRERGQAIGRYLLVLGALDELQMVKD